MRARLAVASAGVEVELREILLRDKAPEFLAASPKGTVPVMVLDNVLEESLDIMHWALGQQDPEGLLSSMTKEHGELIEECDGPFKAALDHTKYAVRFPDLDPVESRTSAANFIHKLDVLLYGNAWLGGETPTFADFAILPFVRQFAHTDMDWWAAQNFENVQGWLDRFKASDRFASIMTKYTPWKAGDDVILFPTSEDSNASKPNISQS